MAVGTLLSAISAFVLLRDVFAGAAITPAHVMSVGAIVAAIWSGIELWSQLAARRFIAAFGLAVIFAAATCYTVLMAGASGAATVASNAAATEANNSARERELKQLARAEKMHSETADRLQADCVVGKRGKTHCDGLRASVAVYDAAIRGHKATLADLAPPTDAGGAYSAIAKVLAAMPGVVTDVPTLTGKLELLVPFLAAIVAELGAIVALHIGFGHRTTTPAVVSAPAPETQVRQPQSGKPTPPRGTRRKTGRPSDQKVVDFTDRFRTRHGRPPTGSEIRNEFPDLPKSTAFDHAARARTLSVVRAVA
ncbi:MAG: hypothetical protein B7Y80_12960 [Hyphomicrobium sp. 32-62-53]|nr:MAG: hypothetical protein B7Y80_12960 [Hyphomicrobium sp. 32-62-53]